MFFKAAVSDVYSTSHTSTELELIGDVELVNIEGTVSNPRYTIKDLNKGCIKILSDYYNPLHILLTLNLENLSKFLGKELYLATICDGGLVLSNLIYDKLNKLDKLGKKEELLSMEGELALKFVAPDVIKSTLDEKDMEDYKIILPFTQYMEVFHNV